MKRTAHHWYRGVLRMLLGLGCLLVGHAWSLVGRAAETIVYTNNFEDIPLNAVPDDFLVLGGDFAVREADGNRHLELPGAPLETFAVLFGPNAKDNMAVSARIFGTNKGRRYPAFGVGLNGIAGFHLMVAPAKRRLELYRDETVVAHVEFKWEPATWTHLVLEVRSNDDATWTVRGKVWSEGQSPPESWSISFSDPTEPFSGNASVWGKPFSGTPIRFDDFRVERLH